MICLFLLCFSLVVTDVVIAAIVVMIDIAENIVAMVLNIGVVVAAREVVVFLIVVMGVVIFVCVAHVVSVFLLSLSRLS